MSHPPRLHVEQDGEGPVLLLAHGFGGSARNFGPQARALRDRWRVVRFDARGHARSEAPDDPAAYVPDAFADDVGRVLDTVGATRAVVGGLSMGAGVALRFALAHPERTAGLVLAAFPPAAGGGGFAAVAERFADAIEARGLDGAGTEFAWGPSARLDAEAARLVRRGFLEHPPHALAHTLRGLIARQPAVAELAPALGTLDVPAVVIVGSEDAGAIGPSRALADALPRARLVVVARAGHVVNLQRPTEFNAAIGELVLPS